MATLKITNEWLKKFNIILGIVLLAQAIVLMVVAQFDKGLQAIHSSFLAVDTLASDAAGERLLVPATQFIFDYNIAYGLIVLLAVAGGAYILLSTRWRKSYETGMRKAQNNVRWLLFAVVGALAFESVALAVGVRELALLKAIAALTVIGALVWYVCESFASAAKKPHWPTYWIGAGALLIVWLIIGMYVWAAAVYGEGLPAFSIWLSGSAFVTTLLLAAVYFGSLKKYRWFKRYQVADAAMSVLLFILTSAVSWQIFAGILTP